MRITSRFYLPNNQTDMEPKSISSLIIDFYSLRDAGALHNLSVIKHKC